MHFNRGWMFAIEDMEPREVNLPHDTMITEKRDIPCGNGENTVFLKWAIYSNA